MANRRRVVVTGLGAVTPLGNTVPETWEALLAGKSGVAEITRFDVTGMATKISAEVKEFDSTLALDSKQMRKLDVFVQFAAEASRQAIKDAGLTIDENNEYRAGVAIGSGIGGLPWIEKSHKSLLSGGPRKISPFFIPGAIINMAAGIVSMKHGLKGPNISIVTACTTGLHNIGCAARMIQYGDADIMVAGSTEMATSPLGIGGFAAVRALSRRNDDPEAASRPWDKDRDGFVLGEGAAILVLEEYESAKKRGAHIYAELIGFGMSADAYHMTSPDPDGKGFCVAMQNTLNDAGVSKEAVSYINAHGTSTPAGDGIEVAAIKETFGEHAFQLAVSSTKSMTGHLLGASGSLEAIFTILALRDQVVPPTINLDNPSEGCDRLNLVPHQAQEMKMKVAMSNSFGFGGTNGSLLFQKP